jgi:hypothetical protein
MKVYLCPFHKKSNRVMARYYIKDPAYLDKQLFTGEGCNLGTFHKTCIVNISCTAPLSRSVSTVLSSNVDFALNFHGSEMLYGVDREGCVTDFKTTISILMLMALL